MLNKHLKTYYATYEILIVFQFKAETVNNVLKEFSLQNK